MRVIVFPGQTLADIAVQEYGTVEALPLIASANNLPMSADVEAGTELECPEKVYDLYLMNYAKVNNIKPATR